MLKESGSRASNCRVEALDFGFAIFLTANLNGRYATLDYFALVGPTGRVFLQNLKVQVTLKVLQCALWCLKLGQLYKPKVKNVKIGGLDQLIVVCSIKISRSRSP